MAITDHTRKVLWALSNNQCARCEEILVRAPEADGDVHAIVGQECHIIARSLAGPRGEVEPRGDIDGIDNLILLCANCHVVVDSQSEKWTPDALRGLKRGHGQKAAEVPPTRSPFSLQIVGRGKPLALELITTGDQVLGLLDGSLSRVHDTANDMSTIQREKVGAFLDNAFDWAEALDVMGASAELEAGAQLQAELDDLAIEGMLVYGTVRQLVLRATDDDAETPWPEAVIRVMHEREARVPVAEAA